MDEIKAFCNEFFDLKVRIGPHEQVIDFLWDFTNVEVSLFLVVWMSAISDYDTMHGGKNPMVDFFEGQGITTYTYQEKEGYLYDGKSKKTIPLKPAKRRIPKQFVLVKGNKQRKIED